MHVSRKTTRFFAEKVRVQHECMFLDRDCGTHFDVSIWSGPAQEECTEQSFCRLRDDTFEILFLTTMGGDPKGQHIYICSVASKIPLVFSVFSCTRIRGAQRGLSPNCESSVSPTFNSVCVYVLFTLHPCKGETKTANIHTIPTLCHVWSCRTNSLLAVYMQRGDWSSFIFTPALPPTQWTRIWQLDV